MFKFSLQYVDNKLKLIIFFIISVFLGLIGLVTPVITSVIIDSIIELKKFNIIFNMCVIYAICQFTKVLFGYINKLSYIKIQTNAAFKINFLLLNHLQRMPLHKVEGIDIGYMNHRINNDSNAITSFVINTISELYNNFIIIIFSTTIMIGYINPIMGSLLIIIGIIYILIYFLFKKKIYEKELIFKEEQDKFFSSMLM